MAPPHGRIEAEGDLGIELRVADFEGKIAGVDAEEIQLFQRRVARGPRDIERKRQLVVRRRRPEQDADRSRAVGEVAVGQAALRREPGPVDAPSELHGHMRPGQLLVQKQRKGVFIDRRRERFCAGGRERPRQERPADRPRQPAPLAMLGLDVEIRGVVLELRADLLALELVVLVLPVAKQGAERA